MIHQDFINTNINVLGVFNLLDYDQNFDLLVEQLTAIKKEQYTPSDKIIILHNDTEYFYYGNKLGFTMHNLLTCWRDLDIPYHVMVVYTNHSELDSAVNPFIVHQLDRPLIIPTLINNQSWRSVLATVYRLDSLMVKNSFLAVPPFTTSKKISYSAFSLIGAERQHRIKFFQYLLKNNLFDCIKVNYQSEFHKKQSTKNPEKLNVVHPAKQLSNIIYTSPHRINETCFSQSRYPDIVDLNSFEACPRNDLEGDAITFYNDFFLEVVLETVFDYPHVFISEKTLKPLLFKTPFVLFSAKGSLEYLKKHKFKTFDDFWDERYDEECDAQLRFLKCCEITKSIITKPLNELEDMHRAMLPILEHNHSRLLEYVETEFKPLYNKIIL